MRGHKTRLFIGTSGWSYPDWKGSFYPHDVPQRRFLDHYATRFPATELNASFYRLPREQMIDGWLERTRADFRFCVKLSRLITHQKKLNDPADALGVFIERFHKLRSRMGPVLAQLPPSLAFDGGRASAFLDARRRRTQLPLAIEARHESWLSEQARDCLGKHNVSLVHAESGGRWPSTRSVTAEFVYLRFHGPTKVYASGHSPEELADVAARITDWLNEGRPVWAFFNNTDGDHAWRNAETLRGLVAKRRGA